VCIEKSVIYKCEGTATEVDKKVHIGLTEKHFNGHKQSLNNKKYKNSTTPLSSYVWKLKERKISPVLKCSIIKHAQAYSNGSIQCNLCLALEVLKRFNHDNFLFCLFS